MNTDEEKLKFVATSSTLQKLRPVIRFWRYIQSEKKDIGNIYVYALIVGLIGLSLPLGIQAVIQMISGGILYDTALLVIILVLLGVAITGALQVMQIYMVEILQRRLFAKATYEFAYRLPKIKADELAGSYPPEVVNRFFDVILLQKGISKILIDLTAAVLQVFFGLVLLAFYHPTFILFDIVFLTAAFVVFKFTGKRGLDTSLKESSYKYKMISWLQEIARNLNTFKTSGTQSNFAINKTDEYTVKYLKARKSHFKVLLTQYINILFFKISIIAATLFLGSLLVVDRQINLGQFVATEIIIVLILGAIEKIIISVDTVYDAFTSAEKIAKISDFEFEQSGTIPLSDYSTGGAFALTLKDVKYMDYTGEPILSGINLQVPAGSTVAIAGKNGYATNALLNIISGIYLNYNGIAEVNGVALKNIDISLYRSVVARSFLTDGLFEATIFENITVGNLDITEIEVVNTLVTLGVYEKLSLLPNGIHTKILPGGIGLPEEISTKICIARNVLKNPKLWLVHEHLYNDVEEALGLFKSRFSNTTIIVVGNNPQLHKKAGIVYLVGNGTIVAHGNYVDIQHNEMYKTITQNSSNA